ncbi:MAG: hypothetical protein M3P49_03760, partial [Actinomycetota bacterium]|nr:hypothetical protein [Actinomycetota bacterium]
RWPRCSQPNTPSLGSETSAEHRERARTMAEECYGNAGLEPDDYRGVVEVYARQLAEHDGDEARAVEAAYWEIESRICELADDDPWWAEWVRLRAGAGEAA